MTAGIRDEDLQTLIAMRKEEQVTMDDMFRALSRISRTADQRIVLMIDEVDSASNNQVFIDFLAQLRGYYLRREDTPTFRSVIPAGVYDIKNLKLKLRSESEHQYNSPWNIAADFDINMSFSASQIVDVFGEYEADHHTGMDIAEVAENIYQYTAGYPVLVSTIYQKIDEKISKEEDFGDEGSAWSGRRIEEAVRRILFERTPLFESMIRHLDDYPEMKRMFREILFQGKAFSFNLDTKEISWQLCLAMQSAGTEKCRLPTASLRHASTISSCQRTNWQGGDSTNLMGDAAVRDRSCFVHDRMLDIDSSSCSI